MKARDSQTGTFKDVYVKALDSMPVGTQIEYTGDTIPTGWEEVNDYSTIEIDTGKKWIDGKPIYRKVIAITDHPGQTSSWTKQLSLSNINKIFLNETYSQWQSTASGNWFQFPYYDGTGYVGYFFTISNGVPTFNLRQNQNIWDIYLVVEYTKTTD